MNEADLDYPSSDEASKADLDVFFAVYPVMIQNNWTVKNVADANGKLLAPRDVHGVALQLLMNT